MKKNKENIGNDSKPDVELRSLIHDSSQFFDKLTPAKFYLPIDDKEKKWFPGLSKGERAVAKKESRENIKKARRDRLDPDKSSLKTLDLLKQNLEKEKENDESDEEEVEINPMISGLGGDDKSATYEDLRQRLHCKIEELRAGRNSGEPDRMKKKKERKETQQKKRKGDSLSEDHVPPTTTSSENVAKSVQEATKELKFSHVKIGNNDELGRKKKRKVSKLKD
ncbi:hypothetical protein K2173_003727 [Erythroxylum novogranatense]|uniref:Ribosomal RNA-processing protein 14 N-terminal domain-containing protein n=1 Tax=Erythroxylum novogranatense TaxID=1862640 RepID=A0AAV8TB26_9ROSI|nr:hypothetical protein K2173_003727 [Erythroxylum novogranatense]